MTLAYYRNAGSRGWGPSLAHAPSSPGSADEVQPRGAGAGFEGR
jgi:hypothetical protein